MSANVINQVTTLVTPILLEEGMELVDLDYRREATGWVLRLYIDKERGVTLDDCARISREVGRILDVENPITTPYALEVSSPGLRRPLKTEKDFLKYRNHLLKVRTHIPIEKQRHFRGQLLNVVNEGIEINMDGRIVHIPFQNIAKANIELE
ncbi:MAG: ribosome maturation factor RimP [Deltaproteobacteria bacterium]|nr:ribosome maturation factor RimP [Deltaproteobacteria bacterium]